LNFTEDNKGLVLVYKGMPKVDRNDRFSIVITPQNYLLKKEHLAIKQEYQSRKIASSLFDEFIDEDKDKYSYFVYRDEDDAWVFIAYKQEDIMKLLNEVGISSDSVDEIFFAQQLVSFMDKPIDLGNDKALVAINGIATVVPKNMLNENTIYENSLTEVHPKKAAISLSSTMALIDGKYASLLSIVFVIFGLLFLIESSRYGSVDISQQGVVSDILKQHPALSSAYTRQSLLSKYKSTDKQQRAIRDFLSKLSKIINDDTKVDTLEIKHNQYNVVLSNSNASALKIVRKKAKQYDLNAKMLSGDKLSIKGTL